MGRRVPQVPPLGTWVLIGLKFSSHFSTSILRHPRLRIFPDAMSEPRNLARFDSI